mgnify:CR=1 FL=1
MSDNEDHESFDLDPSAEELAVECPEILHDEDKQGLVWETSIFDFNEYSAFNGEGFLSLETLNREEYHVEHNTENGVSSIK